MDGICESIECLSDSPQRLRILDALEGVQMDLRDLMEELNSPRTTLQRNLSIVEDRGWVERTSSGYTTTTTGWLLHREVVAMSENAEVIQCLAPFLDAVNAPEQLAIDYLADSEVIVPEPDQPHLPRTRLLSTFDEAAQVCGFLPVVSSMSVEHARCADESVPECEYVVSSDAFVSLRQQYDADDTDGTGIDPPSHIDVRVYDGELPYGLFVSDDALGLVAHNEIDRIQAVIVSTNNETVEWGEQVYKSYREDSTCMHDIDMQDQMIESGIAD